MVLTTILPRAEGHPTHHLEPYIELLREGWSREAAARKVGVSRQTARTFLQGNSATARRWRDLHEGECPLCGCMTMHPCVFTAPARTAEVGSRSSARGAGLIVARDLNRLVFTWLLPELDEGAKIRRRTNNTDRRLGER